MTFDSVYDLAMEEAQDGSLQTAASKADAKSSAAADVSGDEPAPRLSSEATKVRGSPGTAKSATLADAEDNAETAADGPVPTVEVVVSARQGASLDEMVLYQCPYCQKLFDEDEPLEQHILTSHINIIVPESSIWEEAQLPK